MVCVERISQHRTWNWSMSVAMGSSISAPAKDPLNKYHVPPVVRVNATVDRKMSFPRKGGSFAALVLWIHKKKEKKLFKWRSQHVVSASSAQTLPVSLGHDLVLFIEPCSNNYINIYPSLPHRFMWQPFFMNYSTTTVHSEFSFCAVHVNIIFLVNIVECFFELYLYCNPSCSSHPIIFLLAVNSKQHFIAMINYI